MSDPTTAITRTEFSTTDRDVVHATCLSMVSGHASVAAGSPPSGLAVDITHTADVVEFPPVREAYGEPPPWWRDGRGPREPD